MKLKSYYLLFFILIFYTIDHFTKHLYYDDIETQLYNNGITTYVSEDFTHYKVLNFWEYFHKKIDKFSIKIVADRSQNTPFYITIVSDLDALTFTNANYTRHQDQMIIKIDPANHKELFFNYHYKQNKIGEFRLNVISEFEYRYLLPYEGILYGIAYGVIFSAFLYYLVIYRSTKKRYFLYYSIMQFFVLLSLIGFAYFSFQPYPKVYDQAFVDICETLGFLFTLLFAKEVLQTKLYSTAINKVLNIFIVLNILDIFAISIFKYSILYLYVPFYMMFFVTTISGVFLFKVGNKYTKIYTLGWALMAILIFITERNLFGISPIYAIHIIAPLESLIFSFALAYMLKDMMLKQNEQEKLLIHKSKLASMGEMIDNIAHQWRQPLMHLGYINMNLEMLSSSDKFDQGYFIKKIKESNGQIKFMSKTIDDFRDFYKVERKKQEFLISHACKLAINIIQPTLDKKKIKLNLHIQKDSMIKGYENEYAQVILNFLTNSIEIFEIRKIQNPSIDISIDLIDKKTLTTVCDNGGGICEDDIKDIFEAYFSTKQRSSGIGLYMSKVIIQSHFNGDIKIKNSNCGACFSIEV